MGFIFSIGISSPSVCEKSNTGTGLKNVMISVSLSSSSGLRLYVQGAKIHIAFSPSSRCGSA